MGYALGIDLGTTYTAAAIYLDGRVETVSLGSHANNVGPEAHSRRMVGDKLEFITKLP